MKVYEDDGTPGPGEEDQFIGGGFFSLNQLEEAYKTKTPLDLRRCRRGKMGKKGRKVKKGKKGKKAEKCRKDGQIIVRTFRWKSVDYKIQDWLPAGNRIYRNIKVVTVRV